MLDYRDTKEYNEASQKYNRELEEMLSDSSGWDLNSNEWQGIEGGKVLRMDSDLSSREQWADMGERAILNNMEALRDDYEDKGLSEMETDQAIMTDYEDAREEFYSDLNESQE